MNMWLPHLLNDCAAAAPAHSLNAPSTLVMFLLCRFHSRTDAFKQLSIVTITPENCPPSETGVASCIRRAVKEQHDPASGKMPAFHLTTHPNVPNFNLQASAKDHDFGVTLHNALHLRRNVEYCQWRESHTQHCDRCRDGSDSQGHPKYSHLPCSRRDAQRPRPSFQVPGLQLREDVPLRQSMAQPPHQLAPL